MEMKQARAKPYPRMTADEFRAAPKRMGLTQVQAAKKYELSLNAIKQYELDLRPIPGPVRLLTLEFLSYCEKI
jgi:transcriptional regulator with XRE-family HTH domain